MLCCKPALVVEGLGCMRGLREGRPVELCASYLDAPWSMCVIGVGATVALMCWSGCLSWCMLAGHSGIFMLVRLGVVHRGRSQHNAMLLAWGCCGVLGWCRLVRMRQAVREALVPWVGAGWCALGACAVLLQPLRTDRAMLSLPRCRAALVGLPPRGSLTMLVLQRAVSNP